MCIRDSLVSGTVLGVEVPELPADPVGVSNSGEAVPSSPVGGLRGGGEGSSFGLPFGGGGALGGILHTTTEHGSTHRNGSKPVDVKIEASHQSLYIISS